jgi:hypothetical protein
MPIVIPKRDKKVRSLLTTTELTANKNPSLNNLKNIFDLFSMKYRNAKGKKIIWILRLQVPVINIPNYFVLRLIKKYLFLTA